MRVEGLFIPADMWKHVERVSLPDRASVTNREWTDELRAILDCRMLEPIYVTADSELHGMAVVAFGDEEGRLVDQPMINHRATQLLGYEGYYPLVGNIMLFGDDPFIGECHSLPTEIFDDIFGRV